MRIDVDDEVVVGAGFLGGVRKNFAGIGLDADLRQFAHRRRLLAVFPVLSIFSVARRSGQHRLPPLNWSGRGRASAIAGKSISNRARWTCGRAYAHARLL